MRIEMDRKREQITQMCAPRTNSCDFPQSSRENSATGQEERTDGGNVEVVNPDVERQDSEECDSGVNSPEDKPADETFNDAEANSENDDGSQRVVPALPPPNKTPRRSCLKRRPSADAKNRGSVTQFNSNERGSCRDCGSSDVTEMLMAGAHFVESGEAGGGGPTLEMDPIIPSQTKVIDCTGAGLGGSGGVMEVGEAGGSNSQSPLANDNQHQHFQQVIYSCFVREN